ncbi:MAG: PEP-CTERM sorting domain-containing protein [Sedimentisphaerales bacterium]
MIRKSLIVFAVAFVTVLPAFAVPIIQSMSATNVNTSFAGSGGTLTMGGMGGVNLQYTSGAVNTYDNGHFSLNTYLLSDAASGGGIARGTFAGGSFMYQDSGPVTLLSGSITSLSLTEVYDGSGMFSGNGTFTVTGGTLQSYFGANGIMVDISYSITPNTISDFSHDFAGSSNMTILPVPEPATITLLCSGALALLRRKSSK